MLEFKKVSFFYEKKAILSDFDLTLHDGEILAVMGPSGCGKTTLLSLAAGLRKPTTGEIHSTFERVACVFQEPRLFPWLTVRKNLEAVLDAPEKEKEKIPRLLDELGLSGCAEMYPHELSGGMKIRVSLARALLFEGDLYLLDEPFSALDEELKIRLSEFLKQYLKSKNASAILVTHQREDAQRIADRTVLFGLTEVQEAD